MASGSLENLKSFQPYPNDSADLDVFGESGQKCELKSFESRYNYKGEKILLSAGAKKYLDRPQHKSFESALVLTRFYNKDNELERTELQIRSPYLIHAFEQIVPEFKDLRAQKNEITLRDGINYFFYYRTELQDYGFNSGDARTGEHILFALTYMYKALESELQTYYYCVEAAGSNPRIDFWNVWMIFRPGKYMYVKAAEIERVYKIVSVTKTENIFGQKQWSLTGSSIEYDGKIFGYCNTFRSIRFYEGFQQVIDLSIKPLDYHPDRDSIIRRIEQRGRRFVALHGIRHRAYDGTADVLAPDRLNGIGGEEDEFPLQATKIRGRIMLDGKAFYEYAPSHEPNIRKAITEAEETETLNFEDEQYLLCPQYFPGFSLSEKRWCLFNIDLVTEVSYSSNAYESLMLDQKYKQMILSLVNAHSILGNDFDDVIKGKGKGLIFLLHGIPGVESIADYCKRPLYVLDSGEFGTTAYSVTEHLKKATYLAETWKAILLIDEADVFLERRQTNDLARNGLVSVFLRTLEYYQGILFLTTNRIGHFDEAFKSRIHLAIKYPSLSPQFRKDLWQTFLRSTSIESDLDWLDDDWLNVLAHEDLNGRQIKNIARTAYTLALGERCPLTLSHIKMALRAMQAFDSDFTEEIESKRRQGTGVMPEPTSKRRRIDAEVSGTRSFSSNTGVSSSFEGIV